MSGKIKPYVRQHSSDMNVPDEKGKHCLSCKHCSTELLASPKATTDPPHLKVKLLSISYKCSGKLKFSLS